MKRDQRALPASSRPHERPMPGRRGLAPLRVGTLPLLLGLVSACVIPSWPVESSVTSPFGLRWLSGPDLHRGVDLQAATGTPVRAMADGSIRFAGVMGGFGNVVWITHRSDVLSVYAHLSEIQVEVGQPVRRGETIGLSGSSGSVTAPHLHFEVWKGGREVDPVIWLGGFP